MREYNKSIQSKLFGYFKQRLNLKKSTKGYWRADCIYCGGNHTFGLNLEKRKSHCFKCLIKKSPIEVLMEIEKIETLQSAYKFLNLKEEYDLYDRETTRVHVEYKSIELPESFKPINYGDTMMAKSARRYLLKRRFNLTKLAIKGVGYCTTGDYEGYIIFPCYRNGKLIFFQGRKYLSNGPKMRNPPEEEFGIGKTEIIYNVDALYIYRKVNLVESITNAETLGDNTIAILGKVASQKQISEIISSPCEAIHIILDLDAVDNAIGLAMQLVNYKRIKLIIPIDDRDVNDLGKSIVKRWIKDAEYVSYSDLFRLKLNYNAKSVTAYN